jgi:hypothetical protein
VIRIVRTSTLAALRELADSGRRAASRSEEAELRAEEALGEADAQRDRADHAEAQASILYAKVIAELRRLWAAGMDPDHGDAVRGGIALHVIRDYIRQVRESGDQGAIEGIFILGALLGEDPAPAPPEAAPSPSAWCGRQPCPLPYFPGGPVPCAASGKCMRPEPACAAAAASSQGES